jgi:MtN3 and saliva related transmembrane protein
LLHPEVLRPGKIVSVTDVIGWLSMVILLATICRQVYSQWKSKATSGVSRWLFVGQIGASIGFVCYSYQLHNWIFLFSNTAMLLTAIAGEIIYVSNRQGRRKTRVAPVVAVRKRADSGRERSVRN